MQSKTALKPDVFQSFSDIDKRTIKEKREEMDEDDIALSSLSNTRVWQVLNEYIEHLKSEMDELITVAVASGNDFEAIGRLTVLVNLAKEKLYAVQQRVADSKDVGDKAGV